ncbi:Na+/H+ antiporter subunit G [Sphingobium sp. GW456-12-10-14-TSB1]|jgi:multicomponent K+:H+ antiporter subunit G|uniref:Na+/H+ antiporter subunit G n=1 Tax=Sphingobium sp. GW456-12-10-14-TSB1 TaxID=1987165 RepID=UPI000A3C64F4|nr:Na+/H+ antiporter subunit G [Sphingobium sp. GW456-12-10-14-TSB1]OUC56220.1 Na+/H+ antiporter subunit G [Sphingobium sp. GW456-12-10-14-TSB1]|tara:strand:- start:3285 stop:3683 length:399 start_codon:yes stop_codon:yes gene_type:complete
MTAVLDFVIAFLIILGGAFALIGSWGLARLPSLMSRLHGPTKATTLGVGGCLIASMLYFPTHGLSWSAHELLITLFLFITAPISANMIAKASLHGRRVSGDAVEADGTPLPPSPHSHAEWATFGFEDPTLGK